MRKRSIKRYLIGLYILISIVLADNIFKCDAAETADREIVILIDMSLSMSAAWEEVKKWTLEMGMLFNADVKLNLVGFGGETDEMETIYEGVLTDPADEEYKGKVNSLEVHTEYTDQKGALDKATNILQDSDAEMKCIIMLSDGLLDYKNNKDEESAGKDFKNKVIEFEEKENQKICLVQFDSNDTNGIDVFNGFSEKILFKSDADPANILSNESLLNEVTHELFDVLDLPGEQDALIFENNHTTFDLDTNCDRVLLTIKSQNDNISVDVPDTVMVMRQSAIIKPRGCGRIEDHLLLYYSQLDAGEYTLTMPEGHWLGYITYMEKMEIQSINLSILQDNTEIRPNQDGAYELENEKSYQLEVKVELQKTEQLKALDNAAMTCILTSTGDGNETKYTVPEKKGSGVYNFPLNLQYGSDNSDVSYQCYVEIQYGNVSEKSERIAIKSRSTTEPAGEPITKKVYTKESINVCDDLQILNDENYTIYITMDGETKTVDSENKFTENEYDFQKGKITFKKEGTYVISAKIKVEEMKKDIELTYEYEVIKKSFWQKLKEMFSRIKI